jgi:hypothetical protein
MATNSPKTRAHRKRQCQWCDLYRSSGVPLPDHCPEPEIRADMARPAELDIFGEPEEG